MDIEVWQFLLVGIVAFLASIVGGIAGYGTGLLLPPILLPIIGPEALVPVIGVSAVLNNASRLLAFRQFVEWRKAVPLMLCALPTTVIGAFGYTLLSGRQILFFIGAMLIALVPLRRVLASRSVHLSDRGMIVAGAGFGLLIGSSTGSGVMLLAILLGTGMTGLAVISTDAAVTLGLVVAKSATFASAGALNAQTTMVGLFLGVCAIPGAFIAKKLAIQLRNNVHILLLDAVIIIGAVLMIAHAVAR